MQSTVARKHEVVDKSSHFPAPVRIVARRPTVWDRIRARVGQPFTAEKREEIAGIISLLLVFFLTGGFYYTLYLALQNF